MVDRLLVLLDGNPGLLELAHQAMHAGLICDIPANMTIPSGSCRTLLLLVMALPFHYGFMKLHIVTIQSDSLILPSADT